MVKPAQAANGDRDLENENRYDVGLIPEAFKK
jgi:hypothetical protein